MGMSADINGLVRGSVDTRRAVAVGPQGDVKTAKLFPDYTQLVAEGRVWRAQEASATASVVNLPTTAALFSLVNNEPANGKWYVILALYAYNTANAAAVDNFSLACCVQTAEAQANASAQDIPRTSVKPMLSGGLQGAYPGNAILDAGVTVTDDLWFPVGNSGSTAIASATGGSLWVWVNGLIILPPRGALYTVSTATSTSNTTRKGVVWAEVSQSMLLAA